MRQVECEHPDRKYCANGKCGACYDKELKARNPGYAQRQRENTAKWVEANPEKAAALQAKHAPIKNKKRKALQKLAREAQLALQDGRCALCGCDKARAWHWDHDHATGVMRGVLCSKCNNGLGFFNDNPDFLWKAAAYVASYESLSPHQIFMRSILLWRP
jgi:hypothetical protein